MNSTTRYLERKSGPALRGFTLVEILLVVMLLGVLAALVLPQFGSFQNDAKKAALSDTLHQIRSQVLLYTLQHGDQRPALSGSDWSPLLTTSSYAGRSTGPYLPSIPRNSLNGFSDIEVVNTNPAFGDPVSGANIGFVYNSTNGVMWGTNTAGNRIYNEGNPADPAN